MRTLYSEIRPYVTHTLAVDPPHQLHVEEVGNPAGLPVVFLHGGPGAGCEPYHRRFFDPNRYRIVLFDQRGSGHSIPHAELAGNTTDDLIADIERVRIQLKIDRWVVFGGSWGSTLALAYAETYPDRVLGLVLRGIFLCRPHEIRWFYQEGANRLLPDYWQDFLKPIPPEERKDLVSAYYQRLTGSDELARLTAARAWSIWEGQAATLHPNPAVVNHFGSTHTALSLARIECHYFVHDSFLQPNQLLANAYRLAGIPGFIVHGRYDLVCPVENAWELHQAWPSAALHIIPDAGHSATEPGIVDALVTATDVLARQLA